MFRRRIPYVWEKEKMTSKKIPISFNEEYQKKIRIIGKVLGIKKLEGVYGGLPSVIKFSIDFTLQTVDSIEKSIPDLPPKILDILLSSIKQKKEEKYKAQQKELKQKGPK